MSDPVENLGLPHIAEYDPDQPDPTPPDERVTAYENVEVRAAEKPHFSEEDL